MISAKFEQIIDLIEVEFIKHRTLHGRSVEVKFHKFRLALDENEPPPKVVWVPVGGPIETATAGAFDYGSGNNQRRVIPALIRNTLVQCFVFGGESFADTERLLDDVLAAAWHCLGKNANPGSHTWITEEEDEAAHALGDNYLALQPFVFPIMVEAEDRKLVILTAEDHDSELGDTDSDC